MPDNSITWPGGYWWDPVKKGRKLEVFLDGDQFAFKSDDSSFFPGNLLPFALGFRDSQGFERLYCARTQSSEFATGSGRTPRRLQFLNLEKETSNAHLYGTILGYIPFFEDPFPLLEAAGILREGRAVVQYLGAYPRPLFQLLGRDSRKVSLVLDDLAAPEQDIDRSFASGRLHGIDHGGELTLVQSAVRSWYLPRPDDLPIFPVKASLFVPDGFYCAVLRGSMKSQGWWSVPLKKLERAVSQALDAVKVHSSIVPCGYAGELLEHISDNGMSDNPIAYFLEENGLAGGDRVRFTYVSDDPHHYFLEPVE